MFYNPYESCFPREDQGMFRWRRGNFHTHAGTGAGTCGHYPIQNVVDEYQNGGYDVLAITNHDIYVEKPQRQDILVLPGVEYSQAHHMVYLGVPEVLRGTHQQVLDEVEKRGGLSFFCHPHFLNRNYWTWEQMRSLRHLIGLEIFNTVILRLDGQALACDVWDEALRAGRLLWGFGNDDFHRWYDMRRVWNWVYAEDSQESVMDALQAGRFYVSTGLRLAEYAIRGKELCVQARSEVNYDGPITYRFFSSRGELPSWMSGDLACCSLDDTVSYIRAEASTASGQMLWTQPVYRRDKLMAY